MKNSIRNISLIFSENPIARAYLYLFFKENLISNKIIYLNQKIIFNNFFLKLIIEFKPLPNKNDRYIKHGAKYLVFPIQLHMAVKYKTDKIIINK